MSGMDNKANKMVSETTQAVAGEQYIGGAPSKSISTFKGESSLFLTTKQLAGLFNVSERRARQLVMEHGLKPVDLGRGRGNGLRWRTSAVINIADILHAEAQSQESRKLRQPRTVHSVLGKSAAELWAEFNGKKSR